MFMCSRSAFVEESKMKETNNNMQPDPASKRDERPLWHRPSLAILDVEAGTVTTSGPVSDGNGSTS